MGLRCEIGLSRSTAHGFAVCERGRLSQQADWYQWVFRLLEERLVTF